MSTHTEWVVFAALPPAARDARAFAARTLGSWNLSHVADTAALLVSELVTNAIAHAGGVVGRSDAGGVPDPPDGFGEPAGGGFVMLRLALRESLRIEVWDRSGAPPIRRRAAEDAENGRGLELVDALSKEWGCDVLASGGKIVWATVETGPG